MFVSNRVAKSHEFLMFVSKKKLNNAVMPQRQSQFTPKMKANAVPRLLSSLVCIDQYKECNGMTSFKEFMGRQPGHMTFE